MSEQGVQIKVEVSGIPSARRAVSAPSKRAAHPQEGLRAALNEMRHVMKEQFDTQGRVGSAAGWKKLATATKVKKAKLKQDPRILRARGRLYASLTEPRKRYAVGRVTRNGFVYGTSHPAAGFHEEGTDTMYRRSMLDAITPKVGETKGVDQIRSYIVDGFVTRRG